MLQGFKVRVAIARSTSPYCLVLGQDITALGVVRSLHRAGVRCLTIAGRDDIVGWSRCCGSKPLKDPDQCRPEVLTAWLAQQPLDQVVLMPCSDAWAEAIARLDARVARNARSWVPQPDIVRALVDKSFFWQWLNDLDLPHPRTYALNAPGDLDGVPDKVFQRAFLKPRESASFLCEFGLKGIFVATRDEAREKLAAISAKNLEVVFQEYVPGPPTNHVFIDGYRPLGRSGTRLLARRRLRMYPLDLGNSTEMITVPLDDVRPAVDTIETLLEGVGHRGIFSAEFKYDDRDGQFKLLEVNCRPWWYVEFADACGLHVCEWAYQESIGEEIEAFAGYKLHKRAVYPMVDWAARRSDTVFNSRGPLSAVLSWFGAHQPILRWRDPIPAVFNFCRLIKRYLGRRMLFKMTVAER